MKADKFLEAVEAFAAKHKMLPAGRAVIAAVSGGADSMALLTALIALQAKYGYTLAAAHLDHCLRGAESARDREFVARHCAALGIECFERTANIAGIASETGQGIEEAARSERYAFFAELSARIGGAKIATGHNMGDSAETVLLNLTRGAGARGLSGIPPVRGDIIRPLLCVSRAEIEEYLRRSAVPHVEDSTNAALDYSRNRIRSVVLPALREINPRFDQNAAAAAERLAADEVYFQNLARGFLDVNSQSGGVSVSALRALEEPVAARVFPLMFAQPLSSRQIAALMRLCQSEEGTKRLSLSGCAAVREYGTLRATRGESRERAEINAALRVGETLISALDLRVTVDFTVNCEKENKTFSELLFKTNSICGTIRLRARKSGDVVRPAGRGVTKSLKKLMIETRLPRAERDSVPLICDDLGILAVRGVCIDERAAPKLGDDCVRLKFERI